MMHGQVLDVQTAERLERSEMEYLIDRMRAMEERPGNPMGIEIRYFGEAVAFYSKEMPWPQFNTVKGIGSDEESYLSEIISFYRAKNRNPHIEITPLRSEPTLLRTLARHGFFQSSFHATLYRECKNEVTPQLVKGTNEKEIVHIIEINSEQFDDYATVHCLGTGVPK